MSQIVRLVIDQELCMGYGECVDEDPEAVRLEDDVAHLVQAEVSIERARCLCESCPVGAIDIAA